MFRTCWNVTRARTDNDDSGNSELGAGMHAVAMETACPDVGGWGTPGMSAGTRER